MNRSHYGGKVRLSAGNWISLIGLATAQLLVFIAALMSLEHRLTVVETTQINHANQLKEIKTNTNSLRVEVSSKSP